MIATPSSLGRASVPVMSVPILFPAMTVPVVWDRTIPYSVFPEIRLESPETVPPIVVSRATPR